MQRIDENTVMFDNGVMAVADPTKDPEIKYSATTVGIHVGANGDKIEGEAHALEHMVLNEDGIRKDLISLARYLEFKGFNFNAHTSNDYTTYEVQCLPELLHTGIDFLDNTIRNENYSYEETTREVRGVIGSELETYDKDPVQRFGSRVVTSRVFDGTGYAHDEVGTHKSLAQMTIPTFIDFKRRNYKTKAKQGESNIIIASAGRVNKDEFFNYAEEVFGKMKDERAVEIEENWNFRPGVKYVEYDELIVRSREDFDQALLSVSYRIPPVSHPDSFGLEFIEFMFGEGFTSRMMEEIRVRRGLTYDAGSTYLSMGNCGVMELHVTMFPAKKIDQTVGLVLDVIESFPKKIKEDKELFEGKLTHYKSTIAQKTYAPDELCEEWILHYFGKYPYSFKEEFELASRINKDMILDIYERNFANAEPIIAIAAAPGYKNNYSKYLNQK